MANTKSAIKRIRRISKQTIVNKARKSRYKNALKKMSTLIESKNKSEALKFLPKLNSELMKIAKTGIIKRQNASRNISRITKKYLVYNLFFYTLSWFNLKHTHYICWITLYLQYLDLVNIFSILIQLKIYILLQFVKKFVKFFFRKIYFTQS